MLAILSNINCDPIIRKVKRKYECLDAIGYGNILAVLLDPNAEFQSKCVEEAVLLVDLQEMIQFSNDYQQKIDEFFQILLAAKKNTCQYFISDGFYYISPECDYSGQSIARQSVNAWNQRLYQLCKEHSNFHVFPYCKLIQELGVKQFFSDKTWYMGSIRYSMEGVRAITGEIDRLKAALQGDTKKVLALDLDNTLWGGIIGEDGIDGVKLSDSGIGKAYKEFQQIVLEIKKSGIILAIVSKNNEADALEMIDKHPHMVLKQNDFVIRKINWISKSENISAIAKELNVGLDSIVFVDDNPLEREEVKQRFSQVNVPDFPETPEKLAQFGEELVRRFFTKLLTTKEDLEKTSQYLVRQEIQAMQNSSGDFESFLKNMQIKLVRKNASQYMDRFSQLVLKTNQFNTTVKRYSRSELEEMAKSSQWKLYLYEVSDKFTNHGLCAAVAVKIGDVPLIDNFIMSCRVMGRNIEYGILRDVEQDIAEMGYQKIEAVYKAGPKNAPVEQLYDQAGYLPEDAQQDRKQYGKKIPTTNHAISYIGSIEVDI